MVKFSNIPSSSSTIRRTFQGVVMKIRKLVAAMAIAGTIAPAAYADLSLGQWSVVNGKIDAPCPFATLPANTTCSVSAVAEGTAFLQQEVSVTDTTTGNKTVYYRTIVGDPADTAFDPNSTTTVQVGNLAYSDESIVLSGGTNSGILSKQTQADAASGFSGSSQLNMGWAAINGTNQVKIDQSFLDTGPTTGNPPVDAFKGDSFSNTFGLTIATDPTSGDKVGKSMSIDQVLEMGNYLAPNDSDVQRFVVEERQGTFVPTSGSLTLNDTTDPKNTVAWAAGDDIMAVWLGQRVNVADANATSPDYSDFGFERLSDLTLGSEQEVSTSLTASTSVLNGTTAATDVTTLPFAWDATNAPFGDAPTLPAIQ